MLKILGKSAGFYRPYNFRKIFLASRLFNKKCLCRQLIWPNFWIPLTLKIFLLHGYFLKKSTQHSIIWRWIVLCIKQDGGRINICEIFCGKSLKKELSIDTTFDPCYFSWDSPFKRAFDWCLPIWYGNTQLNSRETAPLTLKLFIVQIWTPPVPLQQTGS